MPVEIVLPRLGWSMDEGTFGQWLKKEGDPVAPGDLLFTVEAEKGVQEIEAMDAGYLRIRPGGPQAGESVRVGVRLGWLVESPEQATPDLEVDGAEVSAGRASMQDTAPAVGRNPSGDRGAGEEAEDLIRARMTPRARRLAKERGVDWRQVKGSGRMGRIRERDILAAAAPSSRRGPGRFEPITAFRRTIAERMWAATHQAAPVTLTTRTEAARLVALRESWKAGPGPIPGYTDMILKLVAHTLQDHPGLMAQWTEQGVFMPQSIDIAFAVHTGQGLLAPVLRNVTGLSLEEVVCQTRALAEQARQGRLDPAHLRGAVFTITNLGAQGIDAFTPILNLPQSAILGLGRVAQEPAVVSGKVVAQWQTTLSLTFDHRVLDGVPAAEFLAAMRDRIAAPEMLLSEPASPLRS